MQRPVNSEVEELKKALQATKNVMEYKETEEEHGAYKKVKIWCDQVKDNIQLVAEQPGQILATMSSGDKDTAQGTKDQTREG